MVKARGEKRIFQMKQKKEPTSTEQSTARGDSLSTQFKGMDTYGASARDRPM